MAAFALPAFGLYELFKDHGPADTTSFTAQNGGKGPAAGSLAPEGFDNSQDSLTQATRALSNYTGQAGQGTLKKGQSTFDSGESSLNPVKDYFSKLLYGDKGEVASAMQPQADQIAQQFSQIRQMFSTTGARGGGTASTLAQSPFEQTKQLAELTTQARNNAANQEGNLAVQEAQLGLGQEGVGSNLLNATQQALMERRGQNMNQQTANTEMIAKGLGDLLSALI